MPTTLSGEALETTKLVMMIAGALDSSDLVLANPDLT